MIIAILGIFAFLMAVALTRQWPAMIKLKICAVYLLTVALIVAPVIFLGGLEEVLGSYAVLVTCAWMVFIVGGSTTLVRHILKEYKRPQ